jgi:hypothetical protein
LAYPTVIGVDDRRANSRSTLYFADMSYEWDDRLFRKTQLTLTK